MSTTAKEKVQEKLSFKAKREDFIRILEQVQPGLSSREIVQQSQCYVFRGGSICTFNEEVACRVKTGLPKWFSGAVQASPLLNILRQYPDEHIFLEQKKNLFVVRGKNRRSGITMEKEILLPIGSVEQPEAWRDLHDLFSDAVSIVQECASKDQSAFTFTCIHVHPNYLEACDNLQITRYKLDTGVRKSFLVRRESLKYVPGFDFTQFSETQMWVHFKSPSGLIMSCRRYSEKFEDLSDFLAQIGRIVVLPPILSKVAKRCQEFSSQNSDSDLVLVKISKSRILIKGEGGSGFHEELKRIKYDGPPMSFRIAPNLLIELIKRHTECRISKKHRLTVNGGNFIYAACLEKA